MRLLRRASQGLGRITAIIAAMMIALATMFAFTSMLQQALCRRRLQTNFDSGPRLRPTSKSKLEPPAGRRC